jgi:nitrite reductase/ring-hydroxylating ferredoxin subunit
VPEFVKVATADEIPSGRMKLVDVGGERIAVANVLGDFYAFSDECTHDGGPLSEGDLEGELVTCPWHFSRFSVRTGEVVDSPAEDPVTVYEVRVEGADVLVNV